MMMIVHFFFQNQRSSVTDGRALCGGPLVVSLLSLCLLVLRRSYPFSFSNKTSLYLVVISAFGFFRWC